MLKKIYFLVVIGLVFIVICDPNLAANLPPVKGGVLPQMKLPVPEDPGEKGYLGLSGSGFFSIPQIKAKVVIIEIFSMYCPKCQQIAPGIDKLYYLIESDPNLRNKIKLIGIGAGNSFYEVNVFRKTFNTPFPLFPDEDFSIHKALGNVRSPYFIAIKINKDGTHRVVHSELDSFNEARAFLESIVAASGLKEE
jgi:thiol-disulfide isomerase/thioredoxin